MTQQIILMLNANNVEWEKDFNALASKSVALPYDFIDAPVHNYSGFIEHVKSKIGEHNRQVREQSIGHRFNYQKFSKIMSNPHEYGSKRVARVEKKLDAIDWLGNVELTVDFTPKKVLSASLTIDLEEQNLNYLHNRSVVTQKILNDCYKKDAFKRIDDFLRLFKYCSEESDIEAFLSMLQQGVFKEEPKTFALIGDIESKLNANLVHDQTHSITCKDFMGGLIDCDISLLVSQYASSMFLEVSVNNPEYHQCKQDKLVLKTVVCSKDKVDDEWCFKSGNFFKWPERIAFHNHSGRFNAPCKLLRSSFMCLITPFKENEWYFNNEFKNKVAIIFDKNDHEVESGVWKIAFDKFFTQCGIDERVRFNEDNESIVFKNPEIFSNGEYCWRSFKNLSFEKAMVMAYCLNSKEESIDLENYLSGSQVYSIDNETVDLIIMNEISECRRVFLQNLSSIYKILLACIETTENTNNELLLNFQKRLEQNGFSSNVSLG